MDVSLKFLSLNNPKHRKRFSGNIVVWLSLFHYYMMASGFLAYLFIAKKRLRINSIDFLILISLGFISILHLFSASPFLVVQNLRFYWGWLAFYLIFKVNLVDKKTITNALCIFSFLTLAEVVLINTLILPDLLPNFPKTAQNIEQYTLNLYGEYQRPYSFGGIGTAGSLVLVMMMMICNVKGWRLILSLIAVISIASGSGVLALFLFLLTSHFRILIGSIFLIISFIVLRALIGYADVIYFYDTFIPKLSEPYIEYLIKFKLMQIDDWYKLTTPFEFIIGNPNINEMLDWTGFGSDFLYLSYLGQYGFIGLFILIFFSISQSNKYNRIPIIITLIMSVHYGYITTLPGQMIFGLLLAIQNCDVNYNAKVDLKIS